MNIVLSCNDNPTYSGFIEPVCKYYMNLGYRVHLALVGFDCGVKCTSKVVYPLVDGVDSGIQAKMARSYYATQLDNTIYTIMDIDQFLIRTDWYMSLLIKNQEKLISGNADLMAVGANVYKNTEHVGKWPMAFTASTPHGFRKILECGDMSWEQFILKYKIISNPIDKKEQFSNPFNSFSDESFYRYRVNISNANVIHEDIPNGFFMKWRHRLDRTEGTMVDFQTEHFGYGFWNQNKLTTDQEHMIKSGFFFDCCPARPYEKHKHLIDEIINLSLEAHGV